MAYRFRPVTAADLPLLNDWLALPHVARWWGPEAFTVADLSDPVATMSMVELDGRPFAWQQSYDPHVEPGHHFAHLPAGSRGIDQFIGVSELLGQGHGPGFIRQHVEALRAAGAPRVGTDPHPDNAAAIRAYEKASFRVTGGPMETPWGRVILMETE